MKRLFSIAIAAMLAGQALAQTTFTVGNLKYTVIDEENHYVSVNKSDYFPPNNLVIPETVVKEGVTYTIKSIVENAFKDYSFIESVSLPNTIESIGQGAFSGLAAIKSIDIPISVSSIGTNAFSGVTHLFYSGTATGSPWGAKHINGVLDENGVIYSDNTKSVIISYSGNNGSVTISGNVKLIDRDAFANCSKLKEVVISTTYNDESQYPQTPKIGDYAFSNCQNLERINLGDNILTIGNYAFSGCKKLTSIDIPQSAIYILSGVFMGCSSLTAINVAATNEGYSSVDGVFFNKDKTQLICYPQNKEGKKYIIPNSVTKLHNKSFYCTNNLDTVIITSGVQTIEGAAFQDARSITSVILPNSITKIESMTFYGCNSLESIAIPSSVKTIGDRAFYNCTKLKPIYIPTTVISIGGDAFMNVPLIIYNGTATGSRWGAKAIIKGEADYDGFVYADEEYKQLVGYIGDETMIDIPATVTTIGDKTFSYCSGLKSVTIPNTVTSISSTAFQGCNQLDTLQIYANSIGTEFSNITSLKSIYIGATVTSIATDAFSNCTNLEEVEFYSNTIGTAFSQKTSLKNVIIGNTVETIESGAFAGCTNLKTVEIPSTVTTIGADAFLNVKNIVNNSQATGSPWGALNVGGVEDDGGFIFSDSQKTNLVGYVGAGGDITIPNTVVSIAEKAFANCGNLTSVTISSTVASIALDAFSGCGSLTTIDVVSDNENFSAANGILFNKDKTTIIRCLEAKSATYTIPSTVTRIADSAFYNCKKITSITLADDLVGIGYGAFAGCTLLKFNNQSNASYLGKTGNNYFALIAANSTDITECTINSNCKVIAEDAFQNCSSLSEITIPMSVTNINKNAFKGCNSLTIKCKAVSQPAGWDNQWNPDNRPVEWTKQWTVTVAANNSAYGNVSGGGVVIDGSTADITATPKTGYKFVKWSNGLTNATATITVTKDTTLTAEFAIKTYMVSVAANNSSYGTVGGGGTVNHGSTTTITATPATGYKFVKWSNGSTKATETITVTSDLSLTAEFAIKTYTVAVSANNSSYGTVEGGGSVAHGSTATITATPKTGYKFVKWSNGSTNASETITVTSDLTLTAEFAFIIPEGNQEIPENPIAETPADSTSFRFSILSSSEHTAEVSGYSGTSGNVVIPSKTKIDGVEYIVTAIGDQSFRNNSTVVSVTIPNTVTTIKSNAFRHCVNLEYVVIPSSVTTIGEGPFSEYNKLTAIYVDSENTNFVSYDGVLYSADMKKLVQYPCSKPNSAFEIPNTVERIEYLSFSSCPNLNSLVLPSSLKTIKWWAIAACGPLKSLVIPNSVTTIEGNGIRNCKNLTIYCEAESKPSGWNSSWNSDGCPVEWGYLPSAQKDFKFTITSTSDKTVEVSGYTGTNAIVVIPKKTIIDGVEYTVTGIGAYSLQGRSSITSISIPNTVTSISNNVFANCTSLESISIPNSVTTIGGYAFYNCKKLASLTIPKSVTTIGNGLCSFCEELAAIVVESGNANYVSVDGVLYNSDMTQLVQYPVGKDAESFEFPETVTSTPRSSFRGCSNLKSITFNDKLTSIGGYAFNECDNLTSVVIKKSVTTIGDNAFMGCSNLTIYCEAESQPSGWDSDWNSSNRPVVWGTKQWKVTLTANNDDYGTVTGGGSVVNGSKVTITATPAAGCVFVKWSNGLTNASETITVTSDTTLTAEFIKSEVAIPEDNECSFSVNHYTGCYAAEMATFVGGKDVTIPTSMYINDELYTISSISSKCFQNNTSIISIFIPPTVTVIRDSAFAGCKNLEITCAFDSKPSCWSDSWNPDNLPVVWVCMASSEELDAPTDSVSFSYSYYQNSHTAILTKYYGYSSTVAVPEKIIIKGEEYTVTTILSSCFQDNRFIASLSIPATVTNIEDKAFAGCRSMKINCAYSSKPIGWSNTWNPDNLPVIWGTVEPSNSNAEPPVASDFTYRILSSSYRTVEIAGYTGTKTDIALPTKATIDGVEYTVTGVGAYSLSGCGNITSISIPNTVTSISNNAFANCTSLASISIPNSVTTIGGYAFYNCKKLASLTIPKSVTTIGNGLCSFCEELAAIVVESGNANYVSVDGVLYNSDMTQLVQYPVGKDAESFEFPETVTSTPRSSFRGCSNLKSITFNDKLTSIGGYAFNECDNLTSVVIKKSVTTIGDNAFMGCSNLTIYCEAESQPSGWDSDWNSSNRPVVWGISSGNNNEEFNPEDFTYGIISFSKMTVEIDGYNGTSSNIVIPSTVVLGGDEFTIVSIADETFKDCDNLVSVTLPSTITSIGDAAFQNCSNLESVSLPNTIETIGAGTFAECSSLTSVEIPNSVTFIGNSAFAESGLTSVVIPNSVTEISSYAFRDCADLASVEIPNSVATIGMCAFENCSELGTVVIPGSVSSIGIKAFSGCSNATFECDVEAKPEGWDEWWNYNSRPVVWKNDGPGTAVAESAAAAVNIYAHGNTIVVENADDEIFVYDAMGRLVCRDAIHRVSAKITVNNAGIYVVKVGNTVKRVIIND